MWLQAVEGWLTANATKECLYGCRQWKDGLLLMLLRNVCVAAGSGRMTYC